ncbi:hypothetical protein PP568_06810 [Mycobacteroides abscessus]|uniref:Uncharacterized protein n=1 Tax=Mycobacteroides abscessus subsp. abscessus TaxID=1185650 RepID=A0AB38D3K3_9MYCO|nr:hypothetical protein [Mycobacteroides abscessus]MBE5419566.1 hypothetical protein [Mycobacteroides abscessus]MBE5455735.1 hypothetical protein [Mycobacteroides abscessus]MBN7463629.1 hypothetical protein [Mycobacteroides abscessus subsp. abscessus]MBN7555249.1 hypothetical protein [Mycobacteroides abscessus subsp. abscessus]MDM2404641.1 hypothetical protein [Mycobacteroides abscessus]
MNADRPLDLITIAEAAELLGEEVLGIGQAIGVWMVRGVLMVSQREVIEYQLRSAGLIPAAEWTGPDPV